MARFEKSAAAARPHGTPPRLGDPEAAPDLRTIWAAAAPDPNAKGDSMVAAMLGTTIESYELDVLDTYLDFPAPPPRPAELPAHPPRPADADRLATLFGPELAQSLAASAAAIAHVSVMAERYRADHPGPETANAADYARYARAPNLRLVALAQAFMAAPAFGPDNVARVAAALADHGKDFAVPLSPADRAAAAAALAGIEQKLADGPARRDLSRFADALHAAPCGPLCGVP